MASTSEQTEKEMSEFNAGAWLVHKAETRENTVKYIKLYKYFEFEVV